MGQTSIEWTDVTDNIIVVEDGGWWCRRISPGCDHCYAEALNQNTFFGGNKMPYRGAPPKLHMRSDIVNNWVNQRKSKKHFVSSMTDVFGEWVPRWMIFMMLDGMAAASRQIFQVLTKRPDVMLREVEVWLKATDRPILPPNIWPGCTIENQEWADKRRNVFKQIPARTKFISYEPALGPVDWTGWEFVGQIISGGESGKGARPAHPDWFRITRDWCITNQKAFFFKQWGEWEPYTERTASMFEDTKGFWHDGHALNILDPETGDLSKNWDWDFQDKVMFRKVGKKIAGRLLDGRMWDEVPK